MNNEELDKMVKESNDLFLKIEPLLNGKSIETIIDTFLGIVSTYIILNKLNNDEIKQLFDAIIKKIDVSLEFINKKLKEIDQGS